MSASWSVWLVGGVVLVAAGVGSTLLPRLRARGVRRRVAWSTARAAIDSATVSRDACAARVAEAEQLLARAESIAADRGGVLAAEEAARCAERADRLWRAARRG
ncbi:hypothetical protein DI005_09350 [Prauserella sp. PE36]|uniref:Uncharacterized protein n=1 Tax=Prauserella endophytica TaxID=1592324 RepID=A0ABY2S0B7_9PSEU|nr:MULTISPECIES: DUF6403 family protein [Prauserella]PXY33522.1 hypothetical protein BAY59_10575 [Prauserella coralliicola]RBM21720.1 hypothetical protein DI005_09350 [Prauserella sp. PE36]TKG65764.1 hypothetical protein FCN18_26545 [Prauserella endophytica]